MNGFEKRANEKKEAILKATFDLMNSENGIDNVTIDKVAQHSQTSKATIFKYFESKENLIKKVFLDFFDKLKQQAIDLMEKDQDFESAMYEITDMKIKALDQVHHQFYLDLMQFYAIPSNQEIQDLMEAYRQESYKLTLSLFHRGKLEGKVDLKYSDEFLLLYFETLVNGIAKPEIYTHILPYTKEMTEVMLKGIAPNK